MEVPKALFCRQQWILWRYVGDDKRKVPFQISGEPAKSNDPETWSDYPDAAAAFQRGGFDGLGFVFSADGGLFGCDLDGCRDPESGTIAPWAMKVIESFQTYCEVSPSGTGVKLFGIGSVPGGKGKKKLLGETTGPKLPAVEIYDRGRYFCYTGWILEESPRELADCQRAVNELCESHWPKVRPTAAASPSPLAGVAERAWRYISQIPPAISGSGGHNQTFHVAGVLVHGFALDADTAFSLLSQWNSACVPPWSDKELWHKVNSAANTPGERGLLLGESSSQRGPLVDLTGILLTDPPVVRKPPRRIPVDESMDPAMLHPAGLIDDIIRHNLGTAMYPLPELATAAAISLMATITGRKIRDTFGTRTNCYILGLSPSGIGKDHGRLINKEILMRCGAEKMVGPERVGSAAGMVTAIAESPGILFQLDEIAHLLNTMKNPSKSPHLYNIGTVLMQLYNSSKGLWVGDAYADSKKTKRINQPSPVVYGTAPPEAFWLSLTADNVTDGLLGRLMVFESTDYSEMGSPCEVQVPDGILARVRMWLDFIPGDGNLNTQNPVPIVASYALSARRRIEQHWKDISDRRHDDDPAHAPLWRRSGGKAGKLALIFACSRAEDPKRVEVNDEDVHLAIRLANFMTRRMIHQVTQHVSENDRESMSKRILRIISESGRMTSSELTRKTQWMNRGQRKDIMEDLIHSGAVVPESEPSPSGRPTTYFRVQGEDVEAA